MNKNTKKNAELKVLAVSHSCVVGVNQQLYVEMAKLPEIQLQLMAPSSWISEFDHNRFKTKALKGLNIPFYTMPVGIAGNNSLHFYLWLPLRRIWQFKPDVIFLDEEPWSVAAFQTVLLALFLKSKLVFYTKQNLFKNYPPPFSWFNKLTYKVSAKALSVSREVDTVLRRKGYRKPISYLPHAIDSAAFYAQTKPNVLKLELGLDDSLVIGYVGRLIEAKGIQVLVKAAAVLAKEADLPGWKVLLIGDGEYKAKLQELITQLHLTQYFVFSGSVSHQSVPQYMNCLDIFVLPSLTTPRWKEQFGRVILEALACGVPVVGSDSGEIPYLIKATGGGLIAHEGDEKELSQCLQKLLCDVTLRQQLVEKGLASLKASYTNTGIASHLTLILQQVKSHL